MANRYFENVAARLLARHGVSVIWRLYVQAALHHHRGNWAAALVMIEIADAAERQLSAE